MTPVVPFILFALVSSGFAAVRDDWVVPGALWRVALHADSPPGSPEAGWEIRLPDFGGGRPDMRDVVLLGPDGKEIAIDAVWRADGRALLMLAESMPAQGAATLYGGGNSSRRMKSWTAARSLLLETRRMPTGVKVDSYVAWQNAWRKSDAVDGAAFVPLIFEGGNPFGAESRYLSRYTGWIKSDDDGPAKFYTLSDDVSYVFIDGRPVLKWTENRPPSLDPRKVPMVEVQLRKGLTKVEYCHAAVDAPGAMALGWERGGNRGNVPGDAWVHPGSVKVDAFESADRAPVPLAELNASSYLGFGGEWYVRVSASITIADPDWQVEWLWSDGRTDHGPEVQRLWMSLDPVSVVLRLRKDKQVVEGKRLLVIPRSMVAESVNHPQQLEKFIDLLGKEKASALPEPQRKAGFILAKGFLSSSAAAPWAEAWLKSAKPDGGHWAAAMSLAIGELAKKDPKGALERLEGLPAEVRKALGREADMMELEIRVFRVNDPLAVGLANRLATSGDKLLAVTALIRLGDYQLLNGRIDEAAQCFAKAVPVDQSAARKAPVIDRSHSLAIDGLLKSRNLDEARQKLDAWERERPMAKLEADQLLWRARVNFLAGDFARSLQDLETSLKVRPGAPEEIDVRYWRGRALYELGRKNEAREIWGLLLKEYPKHERAEAAKSWLEKQ